MTAEGPTGHPALRVAVIAVSAALALAGCGSSKTKTVTVTEPSAGSSGAETSAPESSKPPVVNGKVGDTLRTADDYDENGRQIHERLAITLLAVKDNIQAEEALKPDRGNRYLGVRLKITQTGSTSTGPTPDQFGLLDAQGQKYETAKYSGIADPDLSGSDGSIKLDPGETRSGYIVFELPEAAHPTTLKFRDAGAGPAPDTASWKLP